MDIWLWLTGALLVFVCAVCGTIFICTRMRCKSLDNYDFRRENAYRKIEAERDAWYEAYENEHARAVSDEALLRVQKMILAKVPLGGRYGKK